MAGLTAEKIEALITCKKQIVNEPKQNMVSKNRSQRNNMKLFSTDGENSFSVFMRISEEFPEDFSVGLIFHSQDGKNYLLFRCNGPHGEFIQKDQPDNHHHGYHEHLLVPHTTRTMIPSITSEYGTFHDAVAYFIKKCNIIDAERFFPFLGNNDDFQIELEF